MKQNTSHAVMARRFEPAHSADDFPTPPWAARALFEHVLGDDGPSRRMSCLEPACGAGHMAEVLKEFVERVDASDAYDYGYGEVRDFLLEPYRAGSYDWVITNPPFRLAQEFVIKGLEVARIGVALSRHAAPGTWRKSSKSTSSASTPATPMTTAMERFVTSC